MPPRKRDRSGVHVSTGALIGALLLSACAAEPNYERPPVETPAAFKESGDWIQAQPNDAIDRGAWWSIYNDPVLNELEKQIDVSNQNLKAAEAAYRVANAVAEQTRASLFPSLTLNPAASRSVAGNTAMVPVGTIGTNYSLATNASWTPDVWGRIRRSLESDVANAEANAADLASARLSAQAMLATTYFDLRAQDELTRLLYATVQADEKILKLVQSQYTAGSATQAEVFAAQTQFENAKSQAINTKVKRAQLEHAIAVLIGKPPADISIAQAPFAYRIPAVPSEVPSVLLERRPDIASAERAMVAANAQIGVMEAAWYPNLTLSASYGFTGSVLSKLIQAPNSLWTVGASLAETIFDAGAREAGVERAKAGYDQAVAGYRQTVLTAFQQTEDQLAAQRILGEQAKTQEAAVAAARNAEKLTLYQYEHGLSPYDNVLTAQIVALTNEQNTLALASARIDANIALIEALGGGWNVSQISKKKTVSVPAEAQQD
jgi:NodT family efflux transporter outer membrane factor (OMF) lipoprotein